MVQLEARYKRILDLSTDNKLTLIKAFLENKFPDDATEFEFAESCIEQEDHKVESRITHLFKEFL